MSRAALALAVLAATTVRAVADDNAGTGDTIASTWTGGAFQLSENDKRFNLGIATMIHGMQTRIEASAPLDDATRTATFYSKSGLEPAFRATLHIGYDSTYQALALADDDAQLLPYCKAHNIEPCTGSRVAEAQARNGQPIAAVERYWRLGVDASYAYDRTTAYLNDVGTTTSTFRSTDLQLGALVMLYEPGGWVVSLRGGYERDNSVSIGTFMRCVALPSSDPDVTGQSCNQAHILLDNPNPQSSGYARLAGTYYPEGGLLANYLSAGELRLNAENLGQDSASLDAHLLLFAKGLDVGGGSIRIGIGTTVRMALASPAGSTTGRGDFYDYSLFGIAGTSF